MGQAELENKESYDHVFLDIIFDTLSCGIAISIIRSVIKAVDEKDDKEDQGLSIKQEKG